MKFSKSTGLFYADGISYAKIPSDVINVTAEEHAAAFARDVDALEVKNGKLVIVPAPQQSEAELLAQAKSSALTRVDTFHADVVQKLVGNPTQVEKDTWPLKLETSQFILSNTPISPAGLAFLAAANIKTEQDKSDFAKSVQVKACKAAAVVGFAEDIRDTAKAAINAATGQAEIDAALQNARDQAEAAVAQLLAAQKS